MKVKELKEILEMYSDDLEIVLSADGEGNEFRPLDTIEKWDGIPREVFGCNQKFWNLKTDFTKESSLILFPHG